MRGNELTTAVETMEALTKTVGALHRRIGTLVKEKQQLQEDVERISSLWTEACSELERIRAYNAGLRAAIVSPDPLVTEDSRKNEQIRALLDALM